MVVIFFIDFIEDITWTNIDLLSISYLGTNFSNNLIKINSISFAELLWWMGDSSRKKNTYSRAFLMKSVNKDASEEIHPKINCFCSFIFQNVFPIVASHDHVLAFQQMTRWWP